MKRINFYLSILLLSVFAISCNDEFDMPPLVVPVAEHEANMTIKDFKEKYSFGLYGVWMASEDGKSGVYIPEDEYTDEIREEIQRAGNRNLATVRMSSLKI